MNVVTLNLPLFIFGIALLIWARFRRPDKDFQIISIVLGTFFAQFSLGISWTLDRFCLAGSGFLSRHRGRKSGLQAYLPFIAYAAITSLLFSLGWRVPAGVKTAYGVGRVWIQIAQLGIFALAARAFAVAMQEEEAPRLLWVLLRGAGVVHGVASVYQLFAFRYDMPLLGISRAHGLVLDPTMGADIAAFTSALGLEITRPGGLAGEPKSAAVVFGIVLFGVFVMGHSLDRTDRERVLTVLAGGLSSIGFLVAFSTSAFAGASILAVLLLILIPSSARRRLIHGIGLAALLLVIGWALFGGGVDLWSILVERTIARGGDSLDPPVAAAVHALSEDIKVMLFGTGLGGSSFLTMAYLNETFEYAYAPNIAVVLFLVEVGIFGTLLFLGVFAFQTLKVFRMAHKNNSPETLLLATLAISTMVLCMVGSGIGVGFPLALGTLAGAKKVRLGIFSEE